MPESVEFQRVGSGCGVQGCLFAAVSIFVLLLVGTLVVAFFRFREPPQGVPTPLSAVVADGGGPTPIADRWRPAPGAEGRGGDHA